MSIQHARVLLIEEDATLLQITAFRLELLGYEVISKESAEDALTWLQQDIPDLVVVDEYLPGLQGVEFVGRLSNDMRTAQIPVMLLSANADLDGVQKAYNAGVDEYLVTPFDPAVLEEKIERLLASVGETA